MAKSAHTPGPWKAEVQVIDNGWTAPKQYISITVGEIIVAHFDTSSCEYPETDGENAANARLIAAAPELLEALRETQEILRILVQPDMTMASHQVYYRAHAAGLAARKAIAKATDAEPRSPARTFLTEQHQSER